MSSPNLRPVIGQRGQPQPSPARPAAPVLPPPPPPLVMPGWLRQLAGTGIRSIQCFQMHPKAGPGNWGDCRPAFLVTCNDGDRLVLKAEFNTQQTGSAAKSIAWGSAAMKQVSAQADVRLVNKVELANLKTLAMPVFQPANFSLLTQQYVHELIDSNAFIWYRMQYVEKLRSLEGMLKGKALKLAAKLRDRATLHALGKVVAVDLFIGNSDRFDANGQILNPGNIVFQKQANKSYTPVGLDFFDAQGQAANLNIPAPANWAGLILLDRDTIRLHAEKCVDSLNALLRKHKVPDSDLLSSLSIGTFAVGMWDGAIDLRDFLLQKATEGRFPSGLRDRMDKLGWK